MSDAGSKDKAVTPASNPLNKGEVMGVIGLYEVLAVVVDIKAYILYQVGPVTGPAVPKPTTISVRSSGNTNHKTVDRR